MNRKIGYGVVTVNELFCVDKRGRTSRHIEGRIRVDYMESGHYWLIIDQIRGFGKSIPSQPVPEVDVTEFIDKQPDAQPGDIVYADLGEVWIPDMSVVGIRWYTQEW